ncbi:MAG: tetratricopeptide repeat protein [Planctomycetota bacterium]
MACFGRGIALAIVLSVPTSCATPRSGGESASAALTHFCRGVAAENRGDLESALAAYGDAVQAGARHPTVALARARCWLGLGELDPAYECLKEAWREASDDQRLLSILSEMSYILAPAEEAIGYSERLLLARPSLVRPAHHLEELLTRQGRVSEVVAIFERVVASPEASGYVRRRLDALRPR